MTCGHGVAYVSNVTVAVDFFDLAVGCAEGRRHCRPPQGEKAQGGVSVEGGPRELGQQTDYCLACTRGAPRVPEYTTS